MRLTTAPPTAIVFRLCRGDLEVFLCEVPRRGPGRKANGVARRKTTTRGGKTTRRIAAPAKKKVRKATRRKPATKAKHPTRAKAAKPSARARKRPILKKSPLGKKQLDEFRQMLLQKRRTLLGDMSGMEAQASQQRESGNLSNMPTHMADIGTDNFEHEFTLGLLESEQAVLKEIDEALRRIESKTYGICLGTGEGIPVARLRAKPWAKYTVEYARLLEKGLVRAPDDNGEDEPGKDEDEE